MKKKKHNKRRIRIVPVIITAVVLIAIAVTIVLLVDNKKKRDAENKKKQEVVKVEVVEPPKEITLVAVGDVLNHNPVLKMARRDDGSYDFSNLFVNMKDTISKADIAVVNNETIIGGADLGIEGGHPYLIFNSPDELADNIIDAGFDLVLQSSNHSDDMGPQGIRHCIELWKSKADRIKMIGINESQEERDTIKVMDVGGIKLAVLNYTYGLNGNVLPYGEDYLVDQIKDETRQQVRDDIQRATTLADFVIVFPHWGTEYVVGDSTDEQDDWAQLFTEAGADLIIGTHPHVSEKVEKIIAGNGNESLCYFSLGNFSSNQAYLDGEDSAYSQIEGMAVVKIKKDDTGTYIVYDGGVTGVVPLVCHNDKVSGTPNITVYKYTNYSDDLCAIHATRRQGHRFDMEWLGEKNYEIFGDWIIDF